MADTVFVTDPLPIGGKGTRGTGWWGVWTLIVTESALFGYLLTSYYYLYAQTGQHWPPEGLPDLRIPGLNTAILVSSSVFVWLGERLLRHGRRGWSLLSSLVAIGLGTAFVAIQLGEYGHKTYGPASNLYGSLYFTITGFHLLHVVVGLAVLGMLWLWTALGYFDARKMTAIGIGGLYWHFVDAVWLFVFSTFFLVPYL